MLLSNSSQNFKLLSRPSFALHAHNNDQLKDMREICLAERTFEVKVEDGKGEGRRKRERDSVGKGESVCVYKRERGKERERVCMCERGGRKERESVCVRTSLCMEQCCCLKHNRHFG